MKTIRQLIRQPVKTIFGIIIIAIAIASLILGVGQAYVATKTNYAIENGFSTVALPVAGYGSEWNSGTFVVSLGLPEEITNWIDQLPQQYPEVVKKIARPSLASAYIPELAIDNCTRHPRYVSASASYFSQPNPTGMPYSAAILEVTLTEIGELTELKYYYTTEEGTASVDGNGVRVKLTGTINRALYLEEGFNDPEGYTVNMTLKLPSMEAYQELALSVGNRYLIYGTNYEDKDWDLRSSLFRQIGEYTQVFKEECMIYSDNPNDDVVARYKDGTLFYALSASDMELYQHISIWLVDHSVMPVFEKVTDEKGNTIAVRTDNYSIYNEAGELISIPAEEYRARYSVPTIVKLDGTAEEFLASQEGAQWRQMAEYIEINSHAFPIIGVDSLGYIAEFARENARIVAGRDFTPEELSTGAKVCVMSESLAAANGIQVGDTLDCQFYNYDINSPYHTFVHEGFGVVNPSAYFYSANTPFNGGAEGYVVIGLYRQDNEWGNVEDNSFAFTPNTIFVPNTSLTCVVDHGETGLFKTVIIENGAVVDFANIVIDAGYDGLFTYHDQGYSALEDSFLNYRESAAMALRIGLGLYGVGLLAVLLLFPLSQRKNLKIMSSLGATRKQRIGHVLLQTISILVPGTMLGFGAGSLLWNDVMEALIVSAGLSFSLQLDGGVLLAIAVLQLAVASALALLAAVLVSGQKNVTRR